MHAPRRPARSLDTLLEAYLRFCDLDEASPSTCATYRRNITHWIDWHQARHSPTCITQIGVDEFRDYFHYLKHEHIPHAGNPRRPAVAQQRGLAPASRNLRWRALAGFWGFLDREGVLLKQQRDFFSAGRVPRPAVPKQKRKGVEAPVVGALVRTCATNEVSDLRDKALILLLAQSGMRVSEICRLRDADLDLASQSAIVVGKGGKQRAVYWGRAAAEALGAYLATRGASRQGWLFLGLSTRSQGHLSMGAAREILKARAALAGVDLPAGQPAHGFRRGFARRSLRKGMAAPHLQQLLGHETAAMLQIYVEEELDEQLRAIHRQFWDDD